MSHPGNNGASRKISRSNRFTLFLVTALPTRWLTEKPYRDKVSPLGKAFITSKLLAHELPLPQTRAYCFALVRYLSPLIIATLNQFTRKRALPMSHHNQALTPFESPCFQDSPSTPRAHSRPKAMFTLPWNPLWLISSFWHSNSLISRENYTSFTF